MKRLSEIRHDARLALCGRWGSAVLATLVYNLIAAALSTASTLKSLAEILLLKGSYNVLTDMDWSWYKDIYDLPITIFVILPLGLGYTLSMLFLTRGQKEDAMENIFRQGFGWNYWRGLGTVLLVAIYTFLWALLLVIPGIIKSYSYRMSYYIARDCEDLPIDDCIYLSSKMMKGYKFKLFLLDLSFIGWAFLCILSFGIGFLWLQPYKSCSMARFYEERKAEFCGEDPISEVLKRYN